MYVQELTAAPPDFDAVVDAQTRREGCGEDVPATRGPFACARIGRAVVSAIGTRDVSDVLER